MSQDIRELLKNDDSSLSKGKLPNGHKKRFEARLERALPEQRETGRYLWVQIAAVAMIALAVGFFFLYQDPVSENNSIVGTPSKEQNKVPLDEKRAADQVTLADISPEFKKVEDYYMANLNMGLAKLDMNEENKALIDAFMIQLAELDKEYTRLNTEIAENGPNSETIEALINNLQLRLDLLFKLKNKLDELKKEKNEKFEKNQA